MYSWWRRRDAVSAAVLMLSNIPIDFRLGSSVFGRRRGARERMDSCAASADGGTLALLLCCVMSNSLPLQRSSLGASRSLSSQTGHDDGLRLTQIGQLLIPG